MPKNRRKAPIYWLLQSPKGKYRVWVYYPRLTKDTLSQMVTDYIEPRINREQLELDKWLAQIEAAKSKGQPTAKLSAEAAPYQELLADLHEFRARLLNVIELRLDPDLNDGVLLNIAALRQVVRWRDAQRIWDELNAGEHPWSTVSKQLRHQANVGNLLASLWIDGVGPAPKLSIAFGERLNIITGDNGMGKTFLLDIAWWALTGAWAGNKALPDRQSAQATISFQLGSQTGLAKEAVQAQFISTSQDWTLPDRPLQQALVIYAQMDGGFAIWDPVRNRPGEAWFAPGKPRQDAYRFTPQELWYGKTVKGIHAEDISICEGLLRDWVTWQRQPAQDDAAPFQIMTAILAHLSAETRELIRPVEPRKVYLGDSREYPIVDLAYVKDVPLHLLSAGIKRILGLAYLLVWAWDEHVSAAGLAKTQPARQIIFLFDEVEAHLHPRWQRQILPALMTVTQRFNLPINTQIIAATHSAMVMASLESLFDSQRDRVFSFELEDHQVFLDQKEWIAYGDASAWLVSDLFDLRQARSKEAEELIERAYALLREEVRDSAAIKKIEKELAQIIPENDPFWATWIVDSEPTD